jgi:thiol-disulfide isomerase/thioredoxin
VAGRGFQVDLMTAAAEGDDSGNEENPHPRHAGRLAARSRPRQLAAARRRNYRLGMRLLFGSVLALSLGACHQQAQQTPPSNQTAANPAEGIKGVHRDDKGKPAPAAAFSGPDGKPVKLADLKGKPVLVNLWATWCAPCVKELPTLDRLAQSGAVEVVAVSQDTAPNASVVAFLKEHRIATLKPYQDPNMALSGALGPDTVLPTSILIDANGNEVWRYVGDLDWTSAEAAKLLGEAGAAPKAG